MSILGMNRQGHASYVAHSELASVGLLQSGEGTVYSSLVVDSEASVAVSV